MRKILFVGLIVSILLFLAGCSAGGKAVARVDGGPEIQADVYLERAEQQLNMLSDDLTAGKTRTARTALEATGSYLMYADSAISKIPYTSSARDGFKIRYDAIKQRYDFLMTQIK